MPALQANPPSKGPEEPLSVLELVLLHNLKTRMTDKELSNLTKVDRKTITEVMDSMYERDYLGEDSKPTEKGFNVLNRSDVPVKKEEPIELTDLESLLLKNAGSRKNDRELSQSLNVDLKTVTEKMDKLYGMELITDEGFLTEKGFNVLYRAALDSRTAAMMPEAGQPGNLSENERAPPRTVVIQREIVKVPCKYCGSLNDIAGAQTCARCGARVSV